MASGSSEGITLIHKKTWIQIYKLLFHKLICVFYNYIVYCDITENDP